MASAGSNLGRTGCAIGCLAGIATFILGGPGLLFGLMLWAGSERTVYSRATSPQGWREARVQFDDCGAPCGWAKVVWVRHAWMPSDSPWLSCRAFIGHGTHHVRLEWADERTLLIHHGFARGDVQPVAGCGQVSIVSRFDPALISGEP